LVERKRKAQAVPKADYHLTVGYHLTVSYRQRQRQHQRGSSAVPTAGVSQPHKLLAQPLHKEETNGECTFNVKQLIHYSLPTIHFMNLLKIKHILIAIISTLSIGLLTNNAAQAQKFIDVIGNPPYGSDPVSGVIGSGANPNGSSNGTPGFENGIQGKVNTVGANLSVASISGSQSVGGNTIVVNSSAAETALVVINSSINSNPPERDIFVTALGGGATAQQLAQSMQGLRAGNGSIDPVVLSSAVTAYNSYVKSLIDSSQATQKPTAEIDAVIQGFPPGQKAAQVILGKLLEVAR
jgi:hypothetical protein